MEKSTLIGIAAGFILIFGTILMGDGWSTFLDPASLTLVVGGTVASLFVSFSMDDIKQVVPVTKNFFTFQAPDLFGYVAEFDDLARTARREGLLALDRRINETDDEFLKAGLEMAVDGIDEDEVADLMKQQMMAEYEANQLGVKFYNAAGTSAPAFGMVGTLIGLIQMLQNLSDPAAIGPAMAVAMITTFYGAFLANLLFLPFATKLKAQNAAKLKSRQMVLTGVLAIVRGENPSAIEKRLMLFLGEDGSSNEAEDAPKMKKAA